MFTSAVLFSTLALILVFVDVECVDQNEQNYLNSLYAYEGLPFKRSPLQFKRHISPSYDVEVDAGNLRNLLDVGKRHVSVASDIGGQMQMYNRLFDAGKKKRSAISPAYTFQSSLGLTDALERAGRR